MRRRQALQSMLSWQTGTFGVLMLRSCCMEFTTNQNGDAAFDSEESMLDAFVVNVRTLLQIYATVYAVKELKEKKGTSLCRGLLKEKKKLQREKSTPARPEHERHALLLF